MPQLAKHLPDIPLVRSTCTLFHCGLFDREPILKKLLYRLFGSSRENPLLLLTLGFFELLLDLITGFAIVVFPFAVHTQRRHPAPIAFTLVNRALTIITPGLAGHGFMLPSAHALLPTGVNRLGAHAPIDDPGAQPASLPDSPAQEISCA